MLPARMLDVKGFSSEGKIFEENKLQSGLTKSAKIRKTKILYLINT